MKSTRRELADNGANEAKPSDRTWRFWPRVPVVGNFFEKKIAAVTATASTWILARERAVLELARAGVLIAAQDLESEAVPSTLNGAAKC